MSSVNIRTQINRVRKEITKNEQCINGLSDDHSLKPLLIKKNETLRGCLVRFEEDVDFQDRLYKLIRETTAELKNKNVKDIKMSEAKYLHSLTRLARTLGKNANDVTNIEEILSKK